MLSISSAYLGGHSPPLQFASRVLFSDTARTPKAVPQAAVVITNPVHLAVALEYVDEKMDAPRVVAKGQRLVAEKIKELARENDVPIVENPPLAWALFPAVEVGDFIPEEFYRAVAEVLAYVYRIRESRVA